MADDEGFVRRWSRRKSAARVQAGASDPEPATASPPSPTPAPAPTPPAALGPEVPDAVVDPASLPDIESLTYRSDFTVFLRAGVPPELRKLALQRLWRSDPVLANLDGLVEYGEDYSHIGIAPQIVRTAYEVGRGMLDRIETAAAQSPAEPPSVEPPDRDGDDAAFAEPPAIEGSDREDAKAGGVADDSLTGAPQPPPPQR
jgi:Protein of unknown function (DUF3306)